VETGLSSPVAGSDYLSGSPSVHCCIFFGHTVRSRTA
jgi:hypothetical protein